MKTCDRCSDSLDDEYIKTFELLTNKNVIELITLCDSCCADVLLKLVISGDISAVKFLQTVIS